MMKTNKSFSIRIDIPNTDIYKVDIEEIIRDGLEKYESHDKRSFNDVIETTVDVVWEHIETLASGMRAYINKQKGLVWKKIKKASTI